MRRFFWLAGMTVAALLVGMLPAAAAPGAFGADQVVANCSAGPTEASIAPDGTTRGFTTCSADAPHNPVYFFQTSPGQPIVQKLSPWTGDVEATAWDGADSLYVVFADDGDLWIAKRTSSTGAFSAATLLDSGHAGYVGTDLVASDGKWWAVWSRNIGSGVSDYQQLFQRHTLLGVQGITRITSTPFTITDRNPTLSYQPGTVTLIWTRITNPSSDPSCQLRVARNHGAGWSSTPLASLGSCRTGDDQADSIDYNGVVSATWVQQHRVVVGTSSGGAFSTHTFSAEGLFPKIGVSSGKVFLAWDMAQGNSGVLFTQGAGSSWSSSVLSHSPGEPTAVLGQDGKARVLYLAGHRAHLRTQV